MDSSDNFLKQLKIFIESITEEYLIGLTNKGTVNRAKKDLEKVSLLEYKICDDHMEFKFDDVSCSISENINNYKFHVFNIYSLNGKKTILKVKVKKPFWIFRSF